MNILVVHHLVLVYQNYYMVHPRKKGQEKFLKIFFDSIQDFKGVKEKLMHTNTLKPRF